MLIINDELYETDNIKDFDCIVFTIYKREIINKDLSRTIKLIKKLEEAKEHARGKVVFIVDGYNNDKREIYMIPEIREFFKLVYEKYPYLFYFISSLDNNISIIYACLNDYRSYYNSKYTKVGLEIVDNYSLRNNIIEKTKEYGIKINDLENAQRQLFTFL